MKRRYLYLVMFAAPVLLASFTLAALVFSVAAGALWLFAFGDNAWPKWSEPLLFALFIAFGVALSVAGLVGAWWLGKKQEARVGFNRRHLLWALASTAALLVLITAQQWRVGNIGAVSNSLRCAQQCQARGFAASATPPKDEGTNTCTCYDASGGAVQMP